MCHYGRKGTVAYVPSCRCRSSVLSCWLLGRRRWMVSLLFFGQVSVDRRMIRQLLQFSPIYYTYYLWFECGFRLSICCGSIASGCMWWQSVDKILRVSDWLLGNVSFRVPSSPSVSQSLSESFMELFQVVL